MKGKKAKGTSKSGEKGASTFKALDEFLEKSSDP